MPLYEYVCSTCGQNFQKMLPLSTKKPDIHCPSGHRRVHRVYSAPLVIFRGSGFYSTDNRSKHSSGDGKS